MGDAKNDAATDIESKVKDFAKDLTSWSEKWLKEQEKKAKKEEGAAKDATKKKQEKKEPVTAITFGMSNAKVNKGRTPAEQALEVAEGDSDVCWGAHMSDNARHVYMKVNGKQSWDVDGTFGDAIGDFKKKWGELMKSHKVVNAEGKDGYYDGDGFHLELPDSKMSKSDKQAQACLAEYARLTREKGMDKNEKFEKKYKNLLAPHIKKFEKK